MKDKPTRKIKDHIIAELGGLEHFNLSWIGTRQVGAASCLVAVLVAGVDFSRLGDKLHYVSGLMEDRDTIIEVRRIISCGGSKRMGWNERPCPVD